MTALSALAVMARASRRPGSTARECGKVCAAGEGGFAAYLSALCTKNCSAGGFGAVWVEAASGVEKPTVVPTVFVASLTRSTREASGRESDA